MQDGVSPLPSEAAFKIMEHAEHIAAMIAVHTHLAAMLADVQQAEATQAALEAALQSIGVLLGCVRMRGLCLSS